MIGIDTNVLLRLVLQDDEKQGRKATAFFKQLPEIGPGFINCITLMEFIWFLRRRNRLTREQILEVVSDLLDAEDLVLEDEPAIEETLALMQTTGEEFADIFIMVRNRKAGCRSTVSFDERAARKIPGMELLA